jgi:hypothetical protein
VRYNNIFELAAARLRLPFKPPFLSSTRKMTPESGALLYSRMSHIQYMWRVYTSSSRLTVQGHILTTFSVPICPIATGASYYQSKFPQRTSLSVQLHHGLRRIDKILLDAQRHF